jgi:hypothetical protein
VPTVPIRRQRRGEINAIFAATGKRIQALPIGNQLETQGEQL